MPHFGLMDASKMTEADAALLRVRLHIRGGRQRFHRGMLAPGIASLFDALLYAMRWYILLPEHRARLGLLNREDFREDEDLFALLVRGGVIDDAFDYAGFEQLVERSLDDAAFEFDSTRVLEQIVQVMTELEVMPFDEAQLPPENPGAL
jgi:hypothetical protein